MCWLQGWCWVRTVKVMVTAKRTQSVTTASGAVSTNCSVSFEHFSTKVTVMFKSECHVVIAQSLWTLTMVCVFFSLARIWGECSTIHSPPALFFFFLMEISSRTLIALLIPGSVTSDSASWDDCGRTFPDKLSVSSFPDRFLHYAWTAAWSAHSDFVGSRVYASLGVTCHPHFLQNCRVFYVPLR